MSLPAVYTSKPRQWQYLSVLGHDVLLHDCPLGIEFRERLVAAGMMLASVSPADPWTACTFARVSTASEDDGREGRGFFFSQTKCLLLKTNPQWLKLDLLKGKTSSRRAILASSAEWGQNGGAEPGRPVHRENGRGRGVARFAFQPRNAMAAHATSYTGAGSTVRARSCSDTIARYHCAIDSRILSGACTTPFQPHILPRHRPSSQ